VGGDAPRALSIFLVEDSHADARLIREALEEQGLPFRLSNAYDGQSALDYLMCQKTLAPEERPDLILLDLNLPRLDGRELLRIIKWDPELRSIPVVILSTSSRPLDIDTCYDLHANAFVTKPRNLSDLYDSMRAIHKYWTDTATLPARGGHRAIAAANPESLDGGGQRGGRQAIEGTA